MTRDSSFRDFRRRADVVRCIPLAMVLTRWGAQPDLHDRSQWRTQRGPLSVTGAKFFNWHLQQGGGGAIDLVMHLSGWDAHAAVNWLEQQLGSATAAATAAPRSTFAAPTCVIPPTCSPPAASPPARNKAAQQHKSNQLRLPKTNLARLDRVRRYLTERRQLAPHLIEPLVEAGKLYADHRGNAVFLMVAGKDNHPIGAELRGTGRQVWRGLAPGTRKDLGYFWIGEPKSERIILCESAIDAVSCLQLHAVELHIPCICISTAGVRSQLPWLHPLIARGYAIYCGFDTDRPGEIAALRLIARHRVIQRLRPPAHDWNDALAASR
jgi:hypothetical protein